MNRIPASEVTNRAMIAGNEKIYGAIVDNGIVKEWVGFGWIPLRDATPEDLENLPVVERGA